MKKLVLLLFMALAFVSCGKEDADTELGAGRSWIRFNTSVPMWGTTLFDIRNTEWTAAYTHVVSGVAREFTVSAATGSTISSHYASLYFKMPLGTNTSAGPITCDFSQPFTVTSYAVLAVGTIAGGTSYSTKAGILTITKLTDQEIEGTFSGTLANKYNENETIEVTNGVFAGKF